MYQQPIAPPAYAPQPQIAMPMAQPAPVMYCPPPVVQQAPPQQQQQQSTTVVLNQPGQNNNNDDVIGSPTFRESSVRCKCNNCRKTVFTTVEAEVGVFTWLMCTLLFICGCSTCFLCLLPFCLDRCKNIRHTCPNCQTTVGVFKRI
ncbi:lipopolysaccharide-induced tumor necrosis factor-alpha factor homolog [Styela clava]